MKEDSNGGQEDAAQQQAAGAEDPQAQGEVTGGGTDGSAGGDAGYEALLAKRDERIAELEAQVAEAAASKEAAEKLRGEIEAVKAAAADERVEYELRLAGARNVKAARALLDEHSGDVAALKEAEPWLFSTASAPQTGATGLPNAGATFGKGRRLKRWEKLAGLGRDDE
ncbi:MAG: hypothetical protein U0J93_02170 [Parolsenella sp.]|uniref:hypothetical protein n=1 Tax=Parolsenella sp. TaxID=2083006 RepID=UPI002E76D26E|nr:hypothetical protein [Parolsenella sp.]MEE1372170.1 hypothetical protein [Parolsenella sp.]